MSLFGNCGNDNCCSDIIWIIILIFLFCCICGGNNGCQNNGCGC